MHLLREIRRLREAELQSDIRLVVGMILQDSASGSIFDNTALGRLQKYEAMVYYADALVANSEYKRAEKIFKQALHMRLEIAFQLKVAKSKPATATAATMTTSHTAPAPLFAAPTTPPAPTTSNNGSERRMPALHYKHSQYRPENSQPETNFHMKTKGNFAPTKNAGHNSHHSHGAHHNHRNNNDNNNSNNNHHAPSRGGSGSGGSGTSGGHGPPPSSFIPANPSLATLPDCVSEVEVKYRFAKCHMAHGQNKEAIVILETICLRKRGAKINMTLAHLYESSGQERAAVQCYKEVLKEYPLSLEAAQGLVRTGQKAAEINSLLLTGLREAANAHSTSSAAPGLTSSSSSYSNAPTKSCPDAVHDPEEEDSPRFSSTDLDARPLSLPPRSSPYFLSSSSSSSGFEEAPPSSSSSSSSEDDGEWVSLWVKGQAALFAGDYGVAIANFESLVVKPLTTNSVHVLSALGQSYYLQGECLVGLHIAKNYAIEKLDVKIEVREFDADPRPKLP